MGILGQQVRRVKVNQLGRQGWRRSASAIEQMWTEIEATIERLPLRYEKVRIYQDGLPECGREFEIVSELAKAGSRNHRLLLKLKALGATIMPTESGELLREEYRLIKAGFASRSGPAKTDAQRCPQPNADDLLGRRDNCIADRINRTLHPGETGILFIGMAHSVCHLLAKDISIHYPIGHPQQPFPGR
jgi:hypothetical protein